MRCLVSAILFCILFRATGSFGLRPLPQQRSLLHGKTSATYACSRSACAAVLQEKHQSPIASKKGLAVMLISFCSLTIPLFSSCIAHASTFNGVTSIDGEARRVFMKGKQNEADGSIEEAQKLYEEVVQSEPDFIYGWSSLGDVLTTNGNLDLALLCYKKAISLRPPSEELANVLLNKASIELASGKTSEALKDLSNAENMGGKSVDQIRTVKAVALTNEGHWGEASTIFAQVVQSSGKNALPWWLRYSMSLLETGRGVEAIGYLQRTMSSFPQEAECKAFAAALYTSQGSPMVGAEYWSKLTSEDQISYSDLDFVKTKLKWGPVSVDGLDKFVHSKFSATPKSAEQKLWMNPLSKMANSNEF